MAEEYTLNFDKDDLEAMQETAQEATDAFIQRREDERVEPFQAGGRAKVSVARGGPDGAELA